MERQENQILIDKLSDSCTDCTGQSLDYIVTILKVRLDDFIIICFGHNAWQLITNIPDFNQFNKSNNLGFFGKYSLSDTSICLVYLCNEIYDLPSKLLIINKNHLGNLIQYCPLECAEDRLEDIFNIKIKSFSENPSLINSFLNSNFNWLSDKGDNRQQKDYLESLVVLKIYQKFDLELSSNFEGYVINM